MLNSLIAFLDVGVPSGPIVLGVGILLVGLILLIPIAIALIVLYIIRRKK